MLLFLIIAACLHLLLGCSITGHLRRQQSSATLAQLTCAERFAQQPDYHSQVVTIKRDSDRVFLVPLDTLDGERIMAVNIEQITIMSKVRSLPERMGKVSIDFIVDLPKELLGRLQGIVVTPYLHKFEEAEPLEDIVIRGALFDKVQQRDYWQYDKYCWAYDPDSLRAEQMFNRFVKYPYPQDVRLDSMVIHRSRVSYYYSQNVNTDETSKKMLITLQGKVTGLDGSTYSLPASDTLTYLISSMLSFVDTLPRYRIKIIDKYVTVTDRNYIQFQVNDSRVLDTLKDNRRQLNKISTLMRQIIEQEEFYVDSITLTASSSPEGSYMQNNILSQGRARALKQYLVNRFGRHIDTMLTVKWTAEDWAELETRIKSCREIQNRDAILALIHTHKDPDKREAEIKRLYPNDYIYLRRQIYPYLRAVTFKYDLRRVGMVKDTIHTTELDTIYTRGVEFLQKRKYARALYLLNDYRDINTAIAYLSMGHDTEALELLATMPENAVTAYLKAIACSRLGRKEQGHSYFLQACRLDPAMEFRGNLDPEITELLKE